MRYTSLHFRLGPEFTPQPIKKIILYTCAISLMAAISNNVFVMLFGIPGPMDWLSLTWWGIENYLLFQPVTFLFAHHTGGRGITFFFLLSLFFNLYILWIFGSDVYHRFGKNPFLRFYFISGIFAGLTALFLMPLTGQYGVLSGATPSILALLMVWTMINPESELLLFFLLPVKAKWLTLGLIGGAILVALSNADLVHFSLYLAAASIGYLYGVGIWGLHSPFPKLYSIELKLQRFASRWRNLTKRFVSRFKAQEKGKKKKETVIVFPKNHINSDDDAFIDAMLAKISKYGQHSLTWQERERMQKISEKRQKTD